MYHTLDRLERAWNLCNWKPRLFTERAECYYSYVAH